MDRRVSGSEFHIAGPATEKAGVPNCVLVRWMTAALFVDDRSLLRWVSSAENVTIGQLNTEGTGHCHTNDTKQPTDSQPTMLQSPALFAVFFLARSIIGYW